jgi:hypothetical protein
MARSFDRAYYKQFIPKEGIPESIFKYSTINKHLESSLREGYLWFSKPSDFNDPFDCYTALVEFRQPEKHVKELAADHFRHLPRAERRKIGRKLVAEPSVVNITYKELLDTTLEMMGVCCFSKRSGHILMWSHYANNHRGLCLVFDPFVDLSYFLTAGVEYTDEFKPLNYFQNKDDALMKMAVTKSLEWAYEEEVRVILPIQNGKQFFNKQALKGIIFGCRTPYKQIEEIKNIVKESGYGDIYYKKAAMERNRFQLTIDDL